MNCGRDRHEEDPVKRGDEKMSAERHITRKENDARLRTEEAGEVLSRAANLTVVDARKAAYAADAAQDLNFSPEEYDRAVEKMRLAAAELTDRERVLLARLWRAVLATAASMNTFTERSLSAYYEARQEEYHRYHRVLSGMVEETLQKRGIVDQQRTS
jgi:hypothetical protein